MNLATEYRPKSFDDVVSQDHIKRILTFQIEEDCIKHSYLFCGGAGTGKTTSARIFAQDVNDGESEPIEIDAASNNGVDNIRDVIESSKMRPIDGRYKVFIIDECHMLSTGAWNALLKTLEEPPETAIFILCTTDPQKIPATIISRVQRFDFKKMGSKQIVERLVFIINEENVNRDMAGAIPIEYDKEAIEYIAKLAQGGMRDAITSLDKVLDYSDSISMETVIEALGVPDMDELMDLTVALLNKDVKQAIEVVNGIFLSGRDMKVTIKNLTNFLIEFSKMFFHIDSDTIDLPSFLIDEIGEDIKNDGYNFNEILSLLTVINKLNLDLKYGSNPLSLINLTVFMICKG